MQHLHSASATLRAWWRSLLPYERYTGKAADRAVERGKELVRYFYYFVAFFAVSIGMRIDGIVSNSTGDEFMPQWPIVWWAESLSFQTVGYVVIAAFVGTAFIAAFYFRSIAARMLVFLAFTQVHAFFNSFEGISHEWFHLDYALFAFALMPNIWKRAATTERRNRFLLWLWGAQAFVLLSYTMGGVAKVDVLINQFGADQISILSPDGLALILAYWGERFQQVGLLGEALIHQPWFGWPFYIIGQLYLLLFAFVVAFRPSLHRVWAALLILFHISTYLAIHIIFLPSIGVLIFLFFNSPFRPERVTWRQMLVDVPVFGDAWRLGRWGWRRIRGPAAAPVQRAGRRARSGHRSR